MKKNAEKNQKLFIIQQTVSKKKKKKSVAKEDQIRKHFCNDYYVSEDL